MTIPRPKDAMRASLTIILVLAFCAALAALFHLIVPPENVDLVNFMLGQLSILTAGAVGYWMNTSKSSSDKNDLLADRPTGTSYDPVHVDPNSDPLPTRHRPYPERRFGQTDNPEGE